MTPTAKMTPTRTQTITPTVAADERAENPTEIRYGWNPFKEINLMNGDGTLYYRAQPSVIESSGIAAINPYARELPKNQLIPFPTFSYATSAPSPDQVDARGRSVLVQTQAVKTALEAASEILSAYAEKGFVILSSLQGMDQAAAQRIFRVVQPFDLPLGEVLRDLSYAAEDRINSPDDLSFDIGDDEPYVVERLETDYERSIARRLLDEMIGGATTAVNYATETLNATETSMTARFSGGSGKTGADPLDRYLSEELGRPLPKLVGAGAAQSQAQEELGKKIDYLVDRQIANDKDAEIAALRAELAIFSQRPGDDVRLAVNDGVIAEPKTAMPIGEVTQCGAATRAGTPCKTMTRNGERCSQHAEDDGEE